MGRKGGKYKRKEINVSAKKTAVTFNSEDADLMNDEIDAFHKQRDVVPLRLNDNMEDSDEDNEQPVFDVEDDEDEDQEDEDVDDIENNDIPAKGFMAKIQRTQKYLRSKFGGDEDEILDDANEEEQERIVWGNKRVLHGADVGNEPLSSDDEDAAEEEAEVLKLQSEKVKVMSMVDFGLEEDNSDDETEEEPTFEEILDHRKHPKASSEKEIKDETGLTFEIVKKDLNSLTKEEQMEVVYSSAPELVGLLSELNSALYELENKINPVVRKIREQERSKRGELHYIEVKQLLLQSFCQAITFYLLLKSEGQPILDHPVVSRLVEIKSLIDKMKELDKNLPFVEDSVNKYMNNAADMKLVEETEPKESYSFDKSQIVSTTSSEKHVVVEPEEAAELNTMKSSKDVESQRKFQDKQIGVQSMKMLKARAALEEKLKQKGVFSSVASKNVRVTEHLQPVNRRFGTLADFDDEAVEIDNHGYGRRDVDANGSHATKLSRQLSLRPNKHKVISGDDDIPKRDDIGERRRKHELRILAGAGIKSVDVEDETANLSGDGVADANEESQLDSDLEYYRQVEQQHAAKVAAKTNKYSRTPKVPSLPDTVDGKRLITHQMEKNRGLTRPRKKLTKNPRKKYKLKHKKAEVRRKGQVRDIRKLTGHYGGEASGINAGISHSIRFKN